jgi:putative ABC transport system permease protein
VTVSSRQPSPPRPPRLAEWVLERLFPDRRDYSTVGDLAEEFQVRVESRGAFRARLWYRFEVARALPYRLKDILYWEVSMIRNYFVIALRLIRRHKVYSLINVAGLAVSMACALLIVFWVRDELSYDKFNAHLDSLYRVTCIGDTYAGFSSPAPFAPAVAAEVPEVAAAARVGRNPRLVFRHGDRTFYESGGISTDPELFTMFSFPLVKGDAAAALAGPSGIILSESLARQYFGAEDPIGQSLTCEGRVALNVGGIMADIPRNSHLRFDYAVSIKFAEAADFWGMAWGDFNFMTYVMTAGPADEPALAAKLNAVALRHNCPQIVRKMGVFSLQRLEDVYLHPLGPYDIPLGNIVQVRLFSLIAFFIALIAGVNFVNLATARAEKRAKEVGLRKVAGAERRQLVGQFFGESSLMTFLALLLAVVLAKAALPYFNALTGKALALRVLDPGILASLAAIGVFVGALAGTFPSLYLSSFEPAQVLKGSASFLSLPTRGRSGWIRRGSLRRVLVVGQFAVSIGLIAATLVVARQMAFVRQKSWNLERDQMLTIPFKENVGPKYALVRAALLEDPAIVAVTAKDSVPVFLNNYTSDVGWEGKTDRQNNISMETIRVDPHYFEAMDMPIVAGRGFSDDYPGDVGTAFVLNEEAVRLAGLRDPVGKWFSLYGHKGVIVGVVKDTYFQSFRQETRGQAYFLFRDMAADVSGVDVVLIRVKGGPAGAPFKAALAHIEKVWKSFNPATPFEFGFLDEAIAAQYMNETRQGRLFGIFATLAVVVSCLGLFGLASFTAEQRTKEIGIRKTLGASIPRIMLLLSADYSKAVLAANLVAWPLAWYLMARWLRGFVYRAPLGPWIFLGAGLAALLISWMTVALQTLRSARTNPVDALRFE